MLPLSELGVSTPIPHSLAQEVGLVCAAVYGVVWRYCKRRNGICKASLDTLGLEIGVNRATVMRNIKTLCDLGYLIDQTPDLRNVPHTYVLGKSVAERNSLGEAQADNTEDTSVVIRNSSSETVAECNPTVAYNNSLPESVAQSNTQIPANGQTVAESYLKKEESLNPIESNRQSSESHAHELNEDEQLGKALTDICGYDSEALRNGTKKRLNDALTFLIRKRATPKLIHRFRDEYWWGTSPPRPDQVTEEWHRFLDTVKVKDKKVKVSAI